MKFPSVVLGACAALALGATRSDAAVLEFDTFDDFAESLSVSPPETGPLMGAYREAGFALDVFDEGIKLGVGTANGHVYFQDIDIDGAAQDGVERATLRSEDGRPFTLNRLRIDLTSNTPIGVYGVYPRYNQTGESFDQPLFAESTVKLQFVLPDGSVTERSFASYFDPVRAPRAQGFDFGAEAFGPVPLATAVIIRTVSLGELTLDLKSPANQAGLPPEISGAFAAGAVCFDDGIDAPWLGVFVDNVPKCSASGAPPATGSVVVSSVEWSRDDSLIFRIDAIEATPVPVPPSALFVGCGFGAFVALRRGRRRALGFR